MTKAKRHLLFLREVEGTGAWHAVVEYPIDNPPASQQHLMSHTEGEDFMWLGQHRLGVTKKVWDDKIFQDALSKDGGTKYDPLV